MRVRLGSALASAVAISIGLITLVGLLLAGDSLGFSENGVTTLRNIVRVLLEVATIVIALTVLIGVGNLFMVHLRRIGTRQRSAFYSLFLLGGFIAVIVAWLIEDDEANKFLLEDVMIPIESALAGLVFFALVFGAYRMMRGRVTWANILFILSLLVVLIGALPLSNLEAVKDVRTWLLDVPVSAGARGLLLGIALGTIVTGVRVLTGVDRSYRE